MKKDVKTAEKEEKKRLREEKAVSFIPILRRLSLIFGQV